MSLKDLDKKLYQKDFKQEDDYSFKKEQADNQINEDHFVSKWGNVSSDKTAQMAISKINRISSLIFWILAPILVILMGVSVFYIYQYFSADKEISLSVLAPKSVLRGAPFEVNIDFNNNSKNLLERVELAVFLPEGTAVLDVDKSKRIFRKDMGDLASGEIFQE